MAKAKRVRSEVQDKALTKKQISRSKKIARQQRTIWLGAAAVTVVVLAVLAVGVAQEYVLSPRQPVAIVDGEEISKAEYQKMVRYKQWDLQLVEQNLVLQQSVYDPNDETQQFLYQYLDSQINYVQQLQLSLPTQTLEDLIDEALVRQEATRRGLTVSGDEVQLTIELQFGYDRQPPEPTPTPITTTAALTPTTPVAPMTQEQFKENYGEYIEALRAAVNGFSEEDFRHFVEQGALREKLSEALAAQVPTTDEHVHTYHILVNDEETAVEVLEKLKAGERFADLVAQYSEDEDSKEKGGELGWLAKDQVGISTEVVEAAFALQPGEFSDVVETYLGYHIVTVDERQADYPLDEATLASRKGQAIDNWLTQARETATIERLDPLEDALTP
jgi:parvulin-like peptidyl-prolyl isomerase